MIRKRPSPALLLLTLAFAPLLMFAYLGTFSRLFTDDYRYLGTALESGIWQSLLFWQELRSAEYSMVTALGLLAPVGEAAPSFFPLVIILIGLLGISWLAKGLTAGTGIFERRNLLAVALAALVLSAVFNGMYTAQTYLWLTATVEYTTPVALLILGAALAAEFAKVARSRHQLGIAGIGAALFGFINGGFGEMALVAQIVFMISMVACIFIFLHGRRRHACLTLAIACTLGLLASLALQLSAPGIAYRSTKLLGATRPVFPIRDLTRLTILTMEHILQIAGRQQAFAGFALVLAAGMAAALVYFQPRHTAAGRSRALAFAAKSTVLALFVQLIFIPILWAQSSDNIQVFGRFSFGFASVVLINLALAALLAITLWRRAWLVAKLAAPRGIAFYAGAIFFVIAGLFALSQLRSIHYRAATFLFMSALTLVNLLVWQLAACTGEPRLRQFALLATLSIILTGIVFAGQIAGALFGGGFTNLRIYAPVSFLQMITGLLFGLSLGALVKQACIPAAGLDLRGKSAVALCLLLVLTVACGIIVGHLPHIETAKENAGLWDKNHQEILRLIEADDPAVYTTEFITRIGSYKNFYNATYSPLTLDWGKKLFYGLD